MSPSSITRIARAARPQPSAADLAAVLVQLPARRGTRTPLGTAAQALLDKRLTAAERAAILAIVEAVRLLRERASLAGIDDAGRAVTLLLRDSDATERGPWATTGQIAIGASNGLASRAKDRARADVLITVDAAVHELAHVVQFGRMPKSATPHPAILEGIADAAAILATGDDTLGEEFYRRDARGRYRGAIRELGARTISGPALGAVVSNYHDAMRPGTEEHAGGGVVSKTFIVLREGVGRERTEQLLWAVIRDSTAWKNGGSWSALLESIRRQANALWAGDPAALAAVEAALAATSLDAAAPQATRLVA
jgi:hypothetical protein